MSSLTINCTASLVNTHKPVQARKSYTAIARPTRGVHALRASFRRVRFVARAPLRVNALGPGGDGPKLTRKDEPEE